MTKLAKPIKREVEVPRMRPVIIEIDPERAAIGFHEKGCRRTFWLPIMTAFRMAVLIAEKEK
jgi:hypothetical protein